MARDTLDSDPQGNGGTETLNPAVEEDGNTDQGAPNNPPSQDDAVDGNVQALFMQRAMAESERLRREAVRLCVTHSALLQGPPRPSSVLLCGVC